MKHRTSATKRPLTVVVSICSLATLTLLRLDAVHAAPGGVPVCTMNLNACTSSLSSCNSNLSSCSSDLGTCDVSLSDCSDDLTSAQACGNAVIDAGEQCDQSNLAEQTCASLGFAAGTLKCGAGCVFDATSCSVTRFVDNGDGTVSDLQTGLMWEQKTYGQCIFSPSPGFPIACTTDSDCENNGGGGVCVCEFSTCPRFVGAKYTWNDTPLPCSDTQSESSSAANGTAFTEFLYKLNGGWHSGSEFAYENCTSTDGSNHYSGGFAGHCDWRLPTIAEFQTICPDSDGPCLDSVFGPYGLLAHWSATTQAGNQNNAWANDGFFGGANTWCKRNAFYVRAVRRS